MSRVFGVSCHSPEELIKAVLKVNPNPKFFALPIGTLLINCQIKQTQKVVLILNDKDFVRSWKAFALPEYKNKDIFVFASHDTLLEFSGIIKLDMNVIKTESGRLAFELLDYVDIERYVNAEPNVIKRKKLNYVNKLIKDVQKGSVLNALMTFIYTLPVKTHQKPVKILCGLYFTQNWSKQKLSNQIELLNKRIGLTDKMQLAINHILSDAVSLRFQQAFTELDDYAAADDVAKRNEVSGYEMRYLINMLQAEDAYAKKTKTSIDDYLDNKQ